ncbi:hybrid sensor histidine kinase/response regulator [Pedobacter yulinensis]|uniref:histidine kinase n=1 Tax=Pedobacter yulinensis TaxID=2126353 RepID=A0A2T3HJY2_9SPHI|nr:hybrid sensor histidine kinase/response regulator transcription factor [Pedobacter yulinensis]PST82713.1 hybrid sensor histidine kinase/response regulator [Pedobacter yulinensis]
MAKFKLRTTCLFLALSFLCYLAPAGANQGYTFKQLSLSEGLTQSTVRCMLNDRNGFIWIGTKSGLNRFDRYSLKSYVYRKNNPNSIPGNQISFIMEDRRGTIWVGTENGLAVYDPVKDNFKVIRHRNRPLLARSALELPHAVLFGGDGTLYAYAFADGKVRPLPVTIREKSDDAFTGMKLWHDQTVVLYTRRNGIWTYDARNRLLLRFTAIAEKEIMAVHVDERQQLWVAPYGQGIRAYSRQGKTLVHYNTRNSAISSDVVLDIIGLKGQLWIATDGGGINIFDLQSRNFSVLKHIPGNATSFPENSILSLYHDKEDNLWAGSVRGGLISIRKAFINTYKDAPLGSVYGLSEKTVLSTCEDKSGVLWVGTDGGGINRFDPVHFTVRHYPATFGFKIASVTNYDSDHLLISAFSKGLYLFNKAAGTVRPFHDGQINPRGATIRSSGIAVNVNRVSENDLYLFTGDIFHYNIASGVFSKVNFKHDRRVYSSLLKIASNRQYTYFFSSYGIFELHHASNRVRTILTVPANENPITAVARDRRGIFWIGNRDGLMRFDPATNVTKQVGTSLFDEVSALVADSAGKLWIGAQNMVFLYVSQQNKFAAFGESDGVIPNEFLFKPSLVASSGDVYLGGVKGLLHIKKDIPSVTADPPAISLMSLELNGVPLPENVRAQPNHISIPWNHSSLVIKVMAREKDVFRKKMFRYQISGLRSQVIETYNHQLALGSLPPGNYRILVSCSLRNGGWSNYAEVLKVDVNPPWFRSFWFIALVLFIVAAAVVLLYRTAIAKRERKLQWDMKEHEQKSYEARIRFLIHISHELRTPLTLIYSPLQRLLRQQDMDVELKRKLAGVYKQAGHMKEMIDMVLDVRKIELGQERLNLQRLQLNNWVRKITENFETEFEDRRIRMIYRFDESITSAVFDDKKCALVLTNLLANALKFSEANTNLTISTAQAGGFFRVAVTDEGIGLDHVDVNQLFRPFYQGVHHEHGSGIGLSFSKILVEMHGGRIGATPNKNKGATFYFELPASLEPDHASAEMPAAAVRNLDVISQSPVIQQFETAGHTLLIVEDQSELRTFLVESLKPYFASVYDAADGLEALDLVTSHGPDIVVSDVMMPGIDGFELCKRLKNDIQVSHIPIVLLTTQGDADSRNLGYKLGADAYVAKPFELDFLQTLLENLLRNREAVKARYKSSALFTAPQDGTFSRADEEFMRKLNDLITNNLDNEQLHVEFLTDKMAMSRATLYSKLKNIADIGVNDYINKFRLEKAAYLLVHTDKSIMDIADAVGFSNQRYFSTVFKQVYQTTPTHYRQKNTVRQEK